MVSSAFGAGLAVIALSYPAPVDPFGGAPVFEVELMRDVGMSQPASAQSAASAPPSQSRPQPRTVAARTPAGPVPASTTPSLLSAGETASESTAATDGAAQAEAAPSQTPPATRATSGGDARKGAPTSGAQGGSHDDQYEAQVIRWIDRHKQHPGRLQGVVTLAFDVDRRGRIHGCVIARSSGDSRLDRIAKQQVEAAAPLPRPSRDVTWQTRRITLSLDYRRFS